METTGPIGTLWTGIGLMAFYIALIWLNGVVMPFLTVPLFIIPGTWLMDKVMGKRGEQRGGAPTTRVNHADDAR